MGVESILGTKVCGLMWIIFHINNPYWGEFPVVSKA